MSDPQSSAYRDAGPQDWDETSLVDHPHGSLDSLEANRPASWAQVRDQYERAEWDAERAGPKSVEQARENLAARIDDPACPDSDAEAGAYDEQG